VEGASWLRGAGRGVLGDDAGIGKTVQAAAAARLPALVVCPSYLKEQWAAFLQENYPDDSVALASGTRIQRHAALAESLDASIRNAVADWTIVNIEMLRTYPMPEVETVIFDEFHHFRGRTSEQSKNAEALCKRTPNVFGLTATPMYKDVGDLWHLLHLLDPKEWSAYGKYLAKYARTVDTGWTTRIIGAKNQRMLIADLKPYLLRRTYKQVRLFLPDVIEKHIVIESTSREKAEYLDVKKNYRYDGVPLTSAAQVLHLLRRLTVAAKADAAAKVIDDAGKVPTAVLCWYEDTAEYIASKMHGVVIHGTKPKPYERARIVHSAIGRAQPIVATIASLGEGLDLSACKNVIFAEEDYVPGSMYQVSRRFQRWTENTAPVVFTYIRVKGTSDVAVHSAASSRGASIREILRDTLE
jgi:superfamily II DNA or RNA helicase